jgi:hypothetical protein
MPGAPEPVPAKLPEERSAKKALAQLEINNPNVKNPKIVEQEPPMPETGLIEKVTPDGEHKYVLWVYPEYDPNIAHSILVWLHPPGKNSKEELDAWADFWDKDHCRKQHIIIVMPVEKQDGWQPAYADYVVASVRETMKTYTVDNQRVVAHGLGNGGQMALHLAFNYRDLFRGAIVTGAVVGQIKDNVLPGGRRSRPLEQEHRREPHAPRGAPLSGVLSRDAAARPRVSEHGHDQRGGAVVGFVG